MRVSLIQLQPEPNADNGYWVKSPFVMPESRVYRGRFAVEPTERGSGQRGQLAGAGLPSSSSSEIRHDNLRWRQNSAKFRFTDSDS